MIKRSIDWMVSVVSPSMSVRRLHARKVERGYLGAEANRLTANRNPKNQSADSELLGPHGADALRAWARMLVRDNGYAWSALEAIVSETIGTGIGIQSMLESDNGQDEEDTNENRDKTWAEWCEVCDINGQLTYDEIQTLAFREMVEAGECLLHFVTVPKIHNGIRRPVPLALELIEADRLATDKDTHHRKNVDGSGKAQNRIVRGVEMDQAGRPVAYWIYSSHPTEPYAYQRTAERVPAKNIQHLFRKDRISQSRGVTWFAPIAAQTRDLGTYIENEIQASAVASCFVAAIKTETPLDTGLPPSTSVSNADSTDANGNRYGYLESGLLLNLKPGESLDSANPGRPNANAGPWISLMLRGMAAGTGTSYESISKDFSQTSYSSSRTSKLENRPRYRRWQNYWMCHFNQTTWDRFCDAAAIAGLKEFPTMEQLLTDRREFAPVEFMPPVWEWVDVSSEQASSEASINAFQTTYADELGGRGRSWRRTFKQRAKEEALKMRLGLVTPENAKTMKNEGDANQSNATAEAVADPSSEQITTARRQTQKPVQELNAQSPQQVTSPQLAPLEVRIADVDEPLVAAVSTVAVCEQPRGRKRPSRKSRKRNGKRK